MRSYESVAWVDLNTFNAATQTVDVGKITASTHVPYYIIKISGLEAAPLEIPHYEEQGTGVFRHGNIVYAIGTWIDVDRWRRDVLEVLPDFSRLMRWMRR